GGEVDLVGLQNLLVDESLQEIVDIVAAEMGVAVGREHLVNVAFTGGDQLQDGNIERAATEIVHRHFAALLLVQTVGQRRRGRFIHQAHDFQAGQFARIFCGLALRIVEIRRHGDHRALNGLAEKRFGPVLQLAKNERRNFRRSEYLVAKLHANYVVARRIDAKWEQPQFALHISTTASHQAFHGIDPALRLRQQTAARRLPNNDSAIWIDADHRRAKRAARRSRNTPRLSGLRIHIRYQAVGCSEIDSDNSSHELVISDQLQLLNSKNPRPKRYSN